MSPRPTAEEAKQARVKREALMDEVIALLDRTDKQGRFLWWRRAVMTPSQARWYYRTVHEIQELQDVVRASDEYQARIAEIKRAMPRTPWFGETPQ